MIENKNIVSFINKINKNKIHCENSDITKIECSKCFFYQFSPCNIIDFLNETYTLGKIKFDKFYDNNTITMDIFIVLYITFLHNINVIQFDDEDKIVIINNDLITVKTSIYKTFVLFSQTKHLGIQIDTSPVTDILTLTLSLNSLYIFKKYTKYYKDNIQKLNAFNKIISSNLYKSLILNSKKLKYIINSEDCNYNKFILEIKDSK
jgi:hypothetical protein